MAEPKVVGDVEQININGDLYTIADPVVRKYMGDILLTVRVPAQINRPTYDGSPHSPEWNTDYDPNKMTISGVTAQTDAGNYTATATLLEGFKWDDGTNAPKTLSWSITRATIQIPAQNGSLTFNNAEQSPQWNANYDSSKMTLGGVTKGTNAGNYDANFTPGKNWQWPDGSIAAKTVTWKINKAAGTLSVSPASLSLSLASLTQNISVTRNGDGAISAVSSSTGIATVKISGNTVSVTGVAKGTCKITISVAESTNYTAPASKEVSVEVSMPSPDLTNNSFDDVAAAGAAGTGANYWHTGDCMEVTLNGNIGDGLTCSNTKLYMFIVDFNYNGENGVYFQGFKTAASNGKDVALCDWSNTDVYGGYSTDGKHYFNMNHWGNVNYGGWKGCDLRYDVLGSVNKAPSDYGKQHTTSCVGYDADETTITSPVANTLMKALPDSLRRNLKPITMHTDNKGGGSDTASNVSNCIDYLPLPTEFNIQGKRTYANSAEQNYQKQFAYYASGNAKQKYNHQNNGTAVLLWCSSVHYSNSDYFCSVNTDGSPNSNNAYRRCGLAPFCRVA